MGEYLILAEDCVVEVRCATVGIKVRAKGFFGSFRGKKIGVQTIDLVPLFSLLFPVFVFQLASEFSMSLSSLFTHHERAIQCPPGGERS